MSAKRKIVFVRHGEYDTESDQIELTPHGHEQARRAAWWLIENGFKDAAVISSPRTRAAQTAQDIANETHSAERLILSEDIFGASMSPRRVGDLDALLERVAGDNGVPADKPLIVVSHAELLSQLPTNRKAVDDVAFCEIVEYEPGTWQQPGPDWYR